MALNRFLLISLLFVTVSVCGCSGEKYGWYMPGASDAQINFDCRECLKKAEHRRTVENLYAGRAAELSGKPYIPYEDEYYLRDDDFRGLKNDYNITSCMKVKGYKWVLKDSN